jgi:hypothetical protein
MAVDPNPVATFCAAAITKRGSVSRTQVCISSRHIVSREDYTVLSLLLDRDVTIYVSVYSYCFPAPAPTSIRLLRFQVRNFGMCFVLNDI